MLKVRGDVHLNYTEKLVVSLVPCCYFGSIALNWWCGVRVRNNRGWPSHADDLGRGCGAVSLD